MDSVRDIYSDIEKLCCKFSYPSESQPIWGVNDVSHTQDRWYLHSESQNVVFFTLWFHHVIFSIFKRFEIKNYKAHRRRNVYIDTKHMESALYGTYALFAFVSGILLVCWPHLFYFSYCVNNLCIPHVQTSHEVFVIYYKFTLLLHVPCNWRVFWGWYLKNNFIQNTVKNAWLQLFHNISDGTNKPQTSR